MNEIALAEYRQEIESAIDKGRYEEAIAHIRHILNAYPRDIGAYWLLGKAMLEAGQYDHAVGSLRRVISADPEHMDAWVAMSEISRRRGEMEAAVWYLERAFELASDDETVAGNLRHLLGELRGSEPERLQLTKGALARLYLRGHLLGRAISELRELLEEHPDRLDLRVALAEALWRDGQRLRAIEACQEILDGQSYNLKANLILGEIWTSSGRAEGEFYLEYARTLDPENRTAQEVFGAASPLALESTPIAPLDYAAMPEEDRPARLADWGSLPGPKPFALSNTSEVMEARIEIPGWLRGFTGRGATDGAGATLPVEALDEKIGEEEARLEEIPEEEILEWLRQLEEEAESSLSEAPEEEEIPARLADKDPEPTAREAPSAAEEAVLDGEPEPMDIPDWLLNLVPPEPGEAARSKATAAWQEDETALPEAPPAEEGELLAEGPPGFESEDLPPENEALVWLQQLAEGETRDLPVGAETETEEQAILEQAAEALGWLEQLVEGEEVARPAESPAAAEPAWEEVEEAVEGDEAQLAEAKDEPPVEDLESTIAARRAYAHEHAADHGAWLDLGRVLWQADRRAEAVETYEHLIDSGELLNEVIPDLQDYVAQCPDVDAQRALGDAYMKADRLTDALDSYRRALTGL
ncbi:MAG: tetratricopeptide repeat protein [Anaerolineae bacterium]|jgi:tetratricopeptide (TPR) repeat protein